MWVRGGDRIPRGEVRRPRWEERRGECNRDEMGQGPVGSAMLGEGKSNGLRWRGCDDKARRVSEVSGSGSRMAMAAVGDEHGEARLPLPLDLISSPFPAHPFPLGASSEVQRA